MVCQSFINGVFTLLNVKLNTLLSVFYELKNLQFKLPFLSSIFINDSSKPILPVKEAVYFHFCKISSIENTKS